MSNQLAQETSPYLLQHKDNPVDWYPWGEKAIAKARQEDKPIFLSIGYSACHWCHVMEHESFESEALARVLNAHFVSIKVDREERPDLDQIYMNAVQMLTGHGGWPMSLFLTPDLKPFYGGTYWPPQASRGMPGFDQILAAVQQAWQERREKAIEGAEHLTEELRKVGLSDTESLVEQLSGDLIDNAAAQMRRAHDPAHGGFGTAPKFPQSMALQLLLRHWNQSGQKSSLEVVRVTLNRMASGGIYDHLGGGFARYSVDARWLVPHFEKMLYDNALLGGAYLNAYLATGDKQYERVVREILNYVLRDMTDPAGGFYSTEDADSEGSEGLYYTWTPDEITAVLGPEKASTLNRVYGVSEEGNFEGRNILHLARTIEQSARVLNRDEQELREELSESRAQLLAARAVRVRPGRD
ncbi:MAG: thioredoxin domain-containing protein, partial [Pirellulales bacterium]|nr:thioredoxin domain-containing protein [Pirellulales bacterium]